eukprot:4404375-Karenia_brevis.AAC.1
MTGGPSQCDANSLSSVAYNQPHALQRTIPLASGTKTHTPRKWNQVEPSRNQAKVLQITHPALHASKPRYRKNHTPRERNQVEPSRSQAKVL